MAAGCKIPACAGMTESGELHALGNDDIGRARCGRKLRNLESRTRVAMTQYAGITGARTIEIQSSGQDVLAQCLGLALDLHHATLQQIAVTDQADQLLVIENR